MRYQVQSVNQTGLYRWKPIKYAHWIYTAFMVAVSFICWFCCSNDANSILQSLTALCSSLTSWQHRTSVNHVHVSPSMWIWTVLYGADHLSRTWGKSRMFRKSVSIHLAYMQALAQSLWILWRFGDAYGVSLWPTLPSILRKFNHRLTMAQGIN